MKKFGILLLLLAVFVAMTVLVSCNSEKPTDEDCFIFYPLDDGTYAVECNATLAQHLTKIVIPKKHDDKKVSTIVNRAFYGCDNVKTIVIPNSVTSIGDFAFSDCSNLTSIEIPNSVTSIGSSAFSGCSNLTSITLPFVGNGSDQTHLGYVFGALSFLDNNIFVPASLKSVTITGGTYISRYAFAGCSNLTSIEIPDSVTTIDNFAFMNCTNLTKIVISNNVSSIYNCPFYGCSNLTIYCEAESKPSGWDSSWNPDNRPVEWGYKK